MNATAAIFRSLRLPNLGIVCASQLIPYYFVLRPAIVRAGGVPATEARNLGLLALGTMLTTLAGYWVNDIFDRKIDALNKPDRVVVGVFISEKTAWLAYFGMLVLLAFLGFCLRLPGASVPRTWGLHLFGWVSAGLFLYAYRLKCTPVLGNIWVAIFCALVPLTILPLEARTVQVAGYFEPEILGDAARIIGFYALFAFFTTLFREMVKDLEDRQGDAACHCHTLPVVKGIRLAQKWAALVGFCLCLLIVFLLFFWLQTGQAFPKIMAGLVFLLTPIFFALQKTYFGTRKNDFSQASLAIKISMLAGLLLMIQ